MQATAVIRRHLLNFFTSPNTFKTLIIQKYWIISLITPHKTCWLWHFNHVVPTSDHFEPRQKPSFFFSFDLAILILRGRKSNLARREKIQSGQYAQRHIVYKKSDWCNGISHALRSCGPSLKSMRIDWVGPLSTWIQSSCRLDCRSPM